MVDSLNENIEAKGEIYDSKISEYMNYSRKKISRIFYLGGNFDADELVDSLIKYRSNN